MLGAQGCPAPSMIFINITNWPNTVLETNLVIGRGKAHRVFQSRRVRIVGMEFGTAPRFPINIDDFEGNTVCNDPSREHHAEVILARPRLRYEPRSKSQPQQQD